MSKKLMFIAPILLILLIMTVVFLYTNNNQPKPEKELNITTTDINSLFTEADKLYVTGKYEESIAHYLRIIELEPDNLQAHLDTAHTYRYWGKYAESEAMFKEALKIDPNNPWIYTDLGKLYRNMNLYQEAETSFYKALEIDPNFENAYSYGLGYLYFEEGRHKESEAMFKKSLAINPNSEIAHSGLGDLYREMGRYTEAEDMYQKVFTINPKSESYLGLAWLYIYQRKFDEAVVACQDFLHEIREKAEVYYTMGVAYQGAGSTTEAIDAFTKAIELNPDNQQFSNALKNTQR